MSGITSRLVFAAIVVAFGTQSALAGDQCHTRLPIPRVAIFTICT